MIRLFVDGELDASARECIQSTLEGDGQAARELATRIHGEQELKHGVGRALAGVAAPAGLRDAIMSSLAHAETEATDVIGLVDHEGARRWSSGRETWIQRVFGTQHRTNVAAVAAVLALIAGAVLFGIFGRTIDDVPTATVDVVGDVARYVDKEHGACTASQSHVQKQSTWHSLPDAEVGLTEALGSSVTTFDLSSLGYEFIGAGSCAVPLERQPSGHMLYQKTVNGRPGPMVSVFVAPARGCCKGICKNMGRGQWSAAKASCKHKVMYSTDGQLVYFLVCCDEDDLGPVARIISQARPAHDR